MRSISKSAKDSKSTFPNCPRPSWSCIGFPSRERSAGSLVPRRGLGWALGTAWRLSPVPASGSPVLCPHRRATRHAAHVSRGPRARQGSRAPAAGTRTRQKPPSSPNKRFETCSTPWAFLPPVQGTAKEPRLSVKANPFTELFFLVSYFFPLLLNITAEYFHLKSSFFMYFSTSGPYRVPL